MAFKPSGGSSGGGGSGTVTSVAAGDASIVVGGTPTVAPTVVTASLAVIAGLHASAGAITASNQKITNLATGTAATDAARVDQLPGTELGYDQITAQVNIASSTEASGTTVISCAAHTFDGAPVIATFFSPQVTTSTAGGSVVINLFEGATQIGRIVVAAPNQTASSSFIAYTGMLRFTPTAGSHTYTVTAFASSLVGTPNVGAGAGGTATLVPTFIRFTKV